MDTSSARLFLIGLLLPMGEALIHMNDDTAHKARAQLDLSLIHLEMKFGVLG
jgi:hypothetical protein